MDTVVSVPKKVVKKNRWNLVYQWIRLRYFVKKKLHQESNPPPVPFRGNQEPFETVWTKSCLNLIKSRLRQFGQNPVSIW